MNLSRKQRRELRTHKLLSRETELNIVSMIDVFAVLVFFLLVNSSIVSSQLNVISMNLPEENAAPPPKEPPLALTIVVRAGSLAVGSRDMSLRTLPNTAEGYDLPALAKLLVEVKRKNSKEQNLTLSLEPEIPYNDLVHIMDTARQAPAAARAQGMPKEMFPNIALADAVADAPAGAAP